MILECQILQKKYSKSEILKILFFWMQNTSNPLYYALIYTRNSQLINQDFIFQKNFFLKKNPLFEWPSENPTLLEYTLFVVTLNYPCSNLNTLHFHYFKDGWSKPTNPFLNIFISIKAIVFSLTELLKRIKANSQKKKKFKFPKSVTWKKL